VTPGRWRCKKTCGRRLRSNTRDGRIDLDVRAVVETEDGHGIVLPADGVGVSG
jgi:hypothetical protein